MKKYPSRIRYDKSHPTVSFRLNRELKKRLEEVLEGKSFADFVKEGLGVREREKASLKKADSEGYKKGYNEGVEDALDKFGIHITCVFCGEGMYVRSPRLKKVAGRCLYEHGYGHETCMRKIGII